MRLDKVRLCPLRVDERVEVEVTLATQNLKENKKIQSQSIFGARGYSISHYARVVRADLLVLNSETKRSSFISRIFPKDLEHILSELPTDVLIIKNRKS